MVAIFLFLLITHFSTTIAQERNLNISLGSSLSPKNNSYWLSSSGQFAFGFYKIDNGFAIGIWMEASNSAKNSHMDSKPGRPATSPRCQLEFQ